MSHVALLVIGDELLSGRVQDANVAYLAQRLATRGMDVGEVRFVGDTHKVIVKALRELKQTYRWIFTTGGIGNTHDDITIGAVAEALHKPLALNKEANRIILQHYPDAPNTFHPFGHAHIPQGATLIDNPVSHVPSFHTEGVYVLPGMPPIMHGMIEALLPHLPQFDVMQSISVDAPVPEGQLAHGLNQVQQQYPSVAVGSYPYKSSVNGSGTTLVARSRNKEQLNQTHKALQALVASHIVPTS